MLLFDGVLSGVSDHVLYKKVCIKGDLYLYAYKAEKKASAEETAYLARRKKQKDFSSDIIRKKKEFFGVIVFESDLDMEPRTAYFSYEDHWLLKLVFKR